MPPIEYSAARFVLPGQIESGDRHLVCCDQNFALIVAIDGLGHGKEAASAAGVAASVLEKHFQEPIISLVESCHEALRPTRGVVMSVASIDIVHGMMTWLGVGNVHGVLLRTGATNGTIRETLLLRGGVVGCQLPPLQAIVLPVSPGDTIAFATDGIRGDFAETLSAWENPQRAAERILDNYKSGNDDALALVARIAQSGS